MISLEVDLRYTMLESRNDTILIVDTAMNEER